MRFPISLLVSNAFRLSYPTGHGTCQPAPSSKYDTALVDWTSIFGGDLTQHPLYTVANRKRWHNRWSLLTVSHFIQCDDFIPLPTD